MAKTDFGELNPDGSIKRDVTKSALSKREWQPGDVTKRVKGTDHFYRVTAGEHRGMTGEDREELEAQAKPIPAVIEAAKPAAKPAAEPKEK